MKLFKALLLAKTLQTLSVTVTVIGNRKRVTVAGLSLYAIGPVGTLVQRPALVKSQGSVKSFLGRSTGWWADTTAALLPGKKEIARGTTENINTEPRGPT